MIEQGAIVVGARHISDLLIACGIGKDAIIRHCESVGHLAFTTGNRQRIVLHHVGRVSSRRAIDGIGVGLGGDGIHVDLAANNSDGIVRAQQGGKLGGNKDILDVVDDIKIRRRVCGFLRIVNITRRLDVVAVINDRGCRIIQVRHHQFEAVDEFDGGNGVTGRVGPRQRDAQRQELRVGSGIQRHEIRVAVAGGQRVGGALIHKEIVTGLIQLIGDSHRERVRQIDQAPALEIDGIVDLETIIPIRPRAIDERRLHQRRARRNAKGVCEKFLH